VATLTQLRAQLADSKSRLLERMDSTYVPLAGDAEIHRVWSYNNSQDQSEYVSFLSTYTSASNPAPQSYVENLRVGRKTWPGIWRLAFVRPIRIKTTPYIVEVLRKGFITQLVDGGVLSWSDARLSIEASRTLHDDIQYIFVRFPGVSPDHVRGIVDSINALPVAAFHPVIRGEDYGEDFYRQYCTFVIEQDGSATINLLVSKSHVIINAYSHWATERQEHVTYHFGVPAVLAQLIIEDHKTASGGGDRMGASATCSYDRREGLFDIILRDKSDADAITIIDDISERSASYTESTSYYWGISEEAARSTYNIPGTVPEGWIYHKRISNTGEGKFTVIISGRQAIAGSREFTIDLGNDDSETHKVAWNQPSSALATIPGPPSGFQQRVSGISRNQDGTWNWHIITTPEDEGPGLGAGDHYFSDTTIHRRMWDTANHLYKDQFLYIRFRHTVKQFPVAAQAFAFARESWLARGNPHRQIAKKRHLGTKVIVEINPGWQDGDGYP
jgi:hypothetical protein